MTLAATVSYIQEILRAMEDRFGAGTFNEYAIVELLHQSPNHRRITEFEILHYGGHRKERFHQGFLRDTEEIRNALTMHGDEWEQRGGEFNLTRSGLGEKFDAVMCLRPRIYLFCNNTEMSLAQLRENPNWNSAFEMFLKISEKFSVTPLKLP